ncbi:MAG: hypothetical protein M1834_003627 [Cirrosporium novae-zelandiae]|nr:MAG: hypothetical protein M1834_003627 [Cirrosporium novae-zelandiae]
MAHANGSSQPKTYENDKTQSQLEKNNIPSNNYAPSDIIVSLHRQTTPDSYLDLPLSLQIPLKKPGAINGSDPLIFTHNSTSTTSIVTENTVRESFLSSDSTIELFNHTSETIPFAKNSTLQLDEIDTDMSETSSLRHNPVAEAVAVMFSTAKPSVIHISRPSAPESLSAPHPGLSFQERTKLEEDDRSRDPTKKLTALNDIEDVPELLEITSDEEDSSLEQTELSLISSTSWTKDLVVTDCGRMINEPHDNPFISRSNDKEPHTAMESIESYLLGLQYPSNPLNTLTDQDSKEAPLMLAAAESAVRRRPHPNLRKVLSLQQQQPQPQSYPHPHPQPQVLSQPPLQHSSQLLCQPLSRQSQITPPIPPRNPNRAEASPKSKSKSKNKFKYKPKPPKPPKNKPEPHPHQHFSSILGFWKMREQAIPFSLSCLDK